MYNEERKKQFIKELKEHATVPSNLASWFNTSEKFETKYDRDVCEWSTTEIIDFLRYLSTPRYGTLVLFKNYFQRYTDWCMINGLVSDSQNHYTELTLEMLCSCIDIHRLRQFVYTREEIIEFTNMLPNYSDKFLLLALFEGVGVKKDDLIKLKLSDLNGNEIKFSNGDTRQISDTLVNYMIEADSETEYTSLTSTGRTRQVVPAFEIIKPLSRTARVGSTPTFIVTQRFKKIASYVGMPDDINQKDILESGRLHMIHEIMNEKKISFEEALTNKYSNDHTEIYGVIQNVTAYIYQYKPVMENYGVK